MISCRCFFGGGVDNAEDASFSRAIGSVVGDVSAKVGGSAVACWYCHWRFFWSAVGIKCCR